MLREHDNTLQQVPHHRRSRRQSSRSVSVSPAHAHILAAKMASVQLPRRDEAIVQAALRNPAWAITEGHEKATYPDAAELPVPQKCQAEGRPDKVCCRSLKGDDERTLVNPAVVKWVMHTQIQYAADSEPHRQRHHHRLERWLDCTVRFDCKNRFTPMTLIPA